MGAFAINSVREKFPALKQPQVYFDNAGGSQTLGIVIDSIRDYLSNNNVQLGASYATGQKSTAKFSEGYAAASRYINTSEEDIVFGSSTTQLFRNLSYAFQFPQGSEIVISGIDHEANIAPWLAMAARDKLTIKWWLPKTKENPTLLASDLKELLSEKTVLVTCTHASNILGTIHDIKAIAEVVHAVPDALLCVDGVAFAPHRQIDVQALGVDFYAFSWYKVYGPHISMLYAKPSAQLAITSLGHYFNPSITLEDRLGLAGETYELVASIPAVLQYFGYSGLADSWIDIERHEYVLQKKLLDYLNGKEEVTVLGENDPDSKKRVATISCVVKGKGSKNVVETVDSLTKGEVGIRWGAFYSNRLVHNFLGLGDEGVVRVSMVHYNTVEEVERLIKLLDITFQKLGE
ncbi:hypothetical protein B7494_g2124 [Chlorociboria aeruginascens]|nr:hypothetical protein B7494_g2124 [Chlorociboria aeruginascens]